MRAIPRRVIGYCRVSGPDQARTGTSLEGQRDEITRWCSAQGYPAPSLRVEVESAGEEKIERRVEQLRLIAEVEPGDAIVVILVDRWSRDIVHGVQSVRALVKRGVHWYSIREGIDASTPQGDSTLGIMSWAADQERRRIRDRTVGRRAELATAGLYVAARPPFGYERTKARKLVIVAGEAVVVRDIFEQRAKGRSLADIAAALEPARGHPAWTLHHVHRMLHCRYVLGEQRRGDGTWMPDAHPAIISHDLWDRAHSAARKLVRGGRKFAKGISAVRLLRGLVWCSACGKRVSVRFGSRDQKRDPEGRDPQYYVCRGVLAGTCKQGWIRGYDTDQAAKRHVLARLVEMKDELAKPPPAPATQKKPTDAVARMARIEGQRRKAVDLATAGAMSAEDLRAALARYDEQAAKVRLDVERERAAQEAEKRAADPKRRAEVLRQVGQVERAWAKATHDERREIVALLAARVEVGRAGVRFTWRTAEELAAEASQRVVT